MDAAKLVKVKSRIQPNDRIIMAKKDILPLKFPVEQDKNTSTMGKPSGLWYAVGTEWIEWIESEMPHWLGKVFYKIEISNKVLRIDTMPKFEMLMKNYGEANKTTGFKYSPKHNLYINWEKVAKDYSGVEIAPYQWHYRHEYMWYYGWDVASGCIWDKSGISSIKRIDLRKKVS
jgi:hypothetical protein